MRLHPTVIMMLGLAACSKLSVENYEKLQEGMTYDQIAAVIGKPSECTEAMMVRHCVWRDGERRISVSFLVGKATLFSAEKIN